MVRWSGPRVAVEQARPRIGVWRPHSKRAMHGNKDIFGLCPVYKTDTVEVATRRHLLCC